MQITIIYKRTVHPGIEQKPFDTCSNNFKI